MDGTDEAVQIIEPRSDQGNEQLNNRCRESVVQIAITVIPGIHDVAAVAMLLLRARHRFSWMTIVTPYTPTMTAGMTTNR